MIFMFNWDLFLYSCDRGSGVIAYYCNFGYQHNNSTIKLCKTTISLLGNMYVFLVAPSLLADQSSHSINCVIGTESYLHKTYFY